MAKDKKAKDTVAEEPKSKSFYYNDTKYVTYWSFEIPHPSDTTKPGTQRQVRVEPGFSVIAADNPDGYTVVKGAV